MSAAQDSAGGGPVSSASLGSSLATHALLPPRFVLGALALVLVVAAIAVATELRIEQVVKGQLAKVIVSPHRAAVAGLTQWLEGAARAVDSVTGDPQRHAHLAACVHGEGCPAVPLDAELAPYAQAAGFTRYRLADLLGEVRFVGPARASAVPLSPVLRRRIAALPRARAQVLPPFIDAAQPALIVAEELRAESGERVGTLLFDLPVEGIGRVLLAARGGSSIETYAFDRDGWVVSESRFLKQLQAVGLLPPDAKSSVLKLALRDPGGDLTHGFHTQVPRGAQPLTRMAASAIAGQSGVDVDGYRDYRGVKVVGIWRWLPELGLGVATEVDLDEAFHTLNELKRLFAVLVTALALAVTGLLAAMALAARARRRQQRAERIAARFGQYRVERKLGEGGMGVVYLARHDRLRRPAAIKLLRNDRITPDAIERFEREVRITSTLTHPNTVAIYDYGRAEDGTLYYAMEYLEGLDLQRLVSRFGRLPPARVVWFLRQMCGSLAEAHARGLVHRDIKPANLLACTRGGVADTLKVLDFGVVQVGKTERLPFGAEKTLLGTPEYMAPELFESSGQGSPQADLYAAGAVAYFLLTGAPPFEGTPTDLAMAHLTEQVEPPSARLGEAIDPGFERIVMACLAKRREARPSSAAGLRALLERTPLAFAWTQADAEAWWAARQPELETLRASVPLGVPTVPTLRRIKPVPITR